MSTRTDVDVAGLLAQWKAGDVAARDRLFDRVYPELSRIAAALLRRERGVSMSARDLIHEAVIRLLAVNRIDWANRAHFLALAAMMIRRELLDHVRAGKRLKRRHEHTMLRTGAFAAADPDVLALNDALDRLARIDAERAEIVEMRFFGGLELGEIASVLGLSESTVKRRWAAARLWLGGVLADEAR